MSRARLAFLLATAATGLSGAYYLLVAESLREDIPAFRRVVDDPRWGYYLGGPSLLVNFIAALLLVGYRSDRRWRGRALPLATVSAAGLGYWVVHHGHLLGLRVAGLRGDADPLNVLLLMMIALIRIVTLTELAATALGASSTQETSGLRWMALGTAVASFLLWSTLAMTHVRLADGQLRWRDFGHPAWVYVLCMSVLIRAGSFIMAATLCVHAARSLRPKDASSTQLA